MDYFIALVVFIFGLVIGSFLNVVIFRLDTEDKIVNARSKCLACGHLLSWYDMFPVFSFLSLGGKCRYCRKKISWQYPLVEIATGMSFVALFAYFFGTFDVLVLSAGGAFGTLEVLGFLSLAYVFSAMVVMFVFDLRHYIIPDNVVYPAIAVASAWKVAEMLLLGGRLCLATLIPILFPALLAAGLFYALILITKGEGMGGGDVKLGFLMGMALGYPNILLALFVGFISGAIVGMALILLKKKEMKSMVPFGPFLIFGFLVSYFYGTPIIDWYWNVYLF